MVPYLHMKLVQKTDTVLVYERGSQSSSFVGGGVFILMSLGLAYLMADQGMAAFIVPGIFFILGLCFIVFGSTTMLSFDKVGAIFKESSKRIIGSSSHQISFSDITQIRISSYTRTKTDTGQGGVTTQREIRIYETRFVLKTGSTQLLSTAEEEVSQALLTIGGRGDSLRQSLLAEATEIATFVGVPLEDYTTSSSVNQNVVGALSTVASLLGK